MGSSIQKALIVILFVVIVSILLYIFYPNLFSLKLPNLFQPHPGSCKILEERYCKTATIISYTVPSGETVFMAAYKLPAGIPIFSPLDSIDSALITANLKNKDGAVKQYLGVDLIDYYNRSNLKLPIHYVFIYRDTQKYIQEGYKPKKGELLGRVANYSIDALGNYNLIFQITTISKENENASEKGISTEENLRKFLNLKN